MTDFSKMTDEGLRVETAKALGWTEVRIVPGIHGPEEDWLGGVNPKDPDAPILDEVPDFPSDLNACHEFEKALGNDELGYISALASSTNVGDASTDWTEATGYQFAMIHATARQRCLALLATLEGEP